RLRDGPAGGRPAGTGDRRDRPLGPGARVPFHAESTHLAGHRSLGRCRPFDGPFGSVAAFPPETAGSPTMSHEPPVSLWPDPVALGPVPDLYELMLMVGSMASGRTG